MIDIGMGVVAGIGGLSGGILGTVLSGMFNLTTTKVEQSAVDERVQSEIYESRRAESLSALAESASILKVEIDACYNMLSQSPDQLKNEDLRERIHPRVKEYMKQFGKGRIYIEDEKLEESLNELAAQYSMAQQHLSQGADQNTIEPTNAPNYDPNELNEVYKNAIDKLRENVNIKQDWR